MHLFSFSLAVFVVLAPALVFGDHTCSTCIRGTGTWCQRYSGDVAGGGTCYNDPRYSCSWYCATSSTKCLYTTSSCPGTSSSTTSSTTVAGVDATLGGFIAIGVAGLVSTVMCWTVLVWSHTCRTGSETAPPAAVLTAVVAGREPANDDGDDDGAPAADAATEPVATIQSKPLDVMSNDAQYWIFVTAILLMIVWFVSWIVCAALKIPPGVGGMMMLLFPAAVFWSMCRHPACVGYGLRCDVAAKEFVITKTDVFCGSPITTNVPFNQVKKVGLMGSSSTSQWFLLTLELTTTEKTLCGLVTAPSCCDADETAYNLAMAHVKFLQEVVGDAEIDEQFVGCCDCSCKMFGMR